MKSHIIVNSDIDGALAELSVSLKGFRIVIHQVEDFLIEHSRAVIKEAYIAEDKIKYIVIAAISFNSVSQNALLKVLEEPPKNIKFIIIVPSRSILLPTIRSRLPMVLHQERKNHENIELDFKNLTLEKLFHFAKEHERLSRHEAKTLIEAMFIEANSSVHMNEIQLNAFDDAYRLIELNSRLQSVIIMLLLPFIKIKRQ